MKYRPHRRLLAESMEEVREIADREDLVRFLRDDLGRRWKFEIPDKAVHIEPYCYDERIDWNTYIVTIDGWGVVGFTDDPLDGSKPTGLLMEPKF